VTRAFLPRLLAALALTAALAPAAALAQGTTPAETTKMVEVDPIRCWWKTSEGAVRIGQQFTLTMTCAVLQNDAVQVVPDESRLGPASMQMAPFEVISGTHPTDLYTADRRFFQYEYVLRLINPDLIGKDTRIPDQIIHYRINSRVSQNSSLQGKDNIYDLPIIWVRVLSMVPNDVTDIRDMGTENFAISDTLLFRANVFDIVAIAAAALGGLFLILAFVRLFLRTRKTRRAGVERGVGAGGILRRVSRELAAVQRESDGGWDEALVGRALAATRVAAAIALGRPVGQTQTAAQAGDGRITVTPWRRKAAAISGGVTTAQITRELNGLPDTASAANRRALEDLQASLAAFTSAQYSRVPVFDKPALDEAASRAAAAVGQLRSSRMWPRPQLRRLMKREPAPAH
jgi:hypothetical protein